MGIPGTIPAHRPRAREQPPTSDRRERALPCRGRVGRMQAGTVPFACDPGRPEPTPAGPGRYSPAPGRGLPGSSSSSRSGRDMDLFSVKLVKTAKCHQKVTKRPSLVPIFQNGSRKSPLDILGKPFCSAFSHKELMGLFEPWVDYYCQNDEVSPVCTPLFVTRKGRSIPPDTALRCHSSLTSARCVIRPYF